MRFLTVMVALTACAVEEDELNPEIGHELAVEDFDVPTPTDAVFAADSDLVPGVDYPITQTIINGAYPSAPRHDAVVSLHPLSGQYITVDPFCSGTLINANTVLTAAHCVDTAGAQSANFRTMAARNLAIYVGDDPYSDIVSHAYTVTRISIHPNYRRLQNRNDIALVRLSRNITEPVTPVANLRSNQGWNNADIGDWFNVAGFGINQGGWAGIKLHTDVPVIGYGCASQYCPNGGYTASQVTYDISQGGVCSGDSGGPLFVTRNGVDYVGGVTSYGDSYCSYYGVSTRVDAFQTWISNF